MDRREFIKTGTLAAVGATALACGTKTQVEEKEAVKGQMEYRTDPVKGDKVSLLGYGCMRWQMIKDEDGNDIIDQESVNELVDRAIEMGVNYFDTAPVYLQGKSEEASAKALSRYPRDSYFVATKLSNFRDFSAEETKAMYQRSLKIFGGYIDYYLLHALPNEENFRMRFVDNGLMEYLLKEREEGRIRHLGFSFHGKADGFDQMMALHETYHWDFCQIQMNYRDWKHAGGRNCNAEYLYEELTKRGIPAIMMEPLLGGRLADVPEHIAQSMKERRPDKSVASWAFRFCGTYPNVLTVLSGMTYREHLEDNLKSYCPLEPLSEDDLQFLEDVVHQLEQFPTVPCTACQYCMPCRWGIDIPGIFAHYNKCVNEGIAVEVPKEEEEGLSEDQKAFKRARRKYLLTYDKALESYRQADHCIGCGECKDKCPQHIDIPRQIHRIDSYVNNLKKSR